MRDVEGSLETALARQGVWTTHNSALPGGALAIGPTASTTHARRSDYFFARSQGIVRGPPSGLRVLGLSCLESIFTIEFARCEAVVEDVDVRGYSIAKAHPTVAHERNVYVRG